MLTFTLFSRARRKRAPVLKALGVQMNKAIPFTLLLIAVLYFVYIIITDILFSLLLSPVLFINLGLPPRLALIVNEILISLIAGAITGFPYGFAVKSKAVFYAFYASMIVFLVYLVKDHNVFTWFHYVSYSLMVLTVTFFSYIGSRIKKTPNKSNQSDAQKAGTSVRGVSCTMNLISEEQKPLIEHLLKLSKLKIDISTLKVQAMKDGGMGSKRFSTAASDSVFDCNISEVTFKDLDGVEVLATLKIDQYGNPFELDMFKADFSKLEKWPNENEL